MFKAALATLLFLSGAVFFGYWQGPRIASDLGLSESQLAPVPGARIVDAGCKLYVGLISSCDVEVDHQGTRHDFDYVLFADLGGRPVTVVAPADAPGALTTDIGVDYAANRAVTFAGAMLLMLGLAVMSAIAFVRERRAA